jgi:hypothetical protein
MLLLDLVFHFEDLIFNSRQRCTPSLDRFALFNHFGNRLRHFMLRHKLGNFLKHLDPNGVVVEFLGYLFHESVESGYLIENFLEFE